MYLKCDYYAPASATSQPILSKCKNFVPYMSVTDRIVRSLLNTIINSGVNYPRFGTQIIVLLPLVT